MIRRVALSLTFARRGARSWRWVGMRRGRRKSGGLFACKQGITVKCTLEEIEEMDGWLSMGYRRFHFYSCLTCAVGGLLVWSSISSQQCFRHEATTNGSRDLPRESQQRTNEEIVARSLDKFPNWVQLIDLFTSVTGRTFTCTSRCKYTLWHCRFCLLWLC